MVGLALMPAMLLSAAALPAADRAALDATAQAIFEPYTLTAPTIAPWLYPIYSAEVAALIAYWQRVLPRDEPDALNDGDWLCQCQEFDHKAFRATRLSTRLLGADTAEVRMRLELGWNTRREARLVMRREGGQWRLDDLFGQDFPKGLKQKLRETIAEDEAQ